MKKVISLFLISFCLGQTGYFGLVSFDYSGSENGIFQAELSDSSFSGASAIKSESEDGTTILISAFQPLDSVSFSALFIYLQTADTNLTSNVWTLPPEDITNPDFVFGFFPVFDSSFFNQFIDLIPDTIALDSIILDSTFLADIFTEILLIVSRNAYVGMSGSLNFNRISSDSIAGIFDIIAIQGVIPPGSINITNGSIQLNGVTLPQVSVEDEPDIPEQIKLYPAYPNPFNPTTNIRFSVEKLNNTSLLIYDITGRIVETLLEEQLPKGNHSITWDASEFPSGVYFLQLVSGNYSQTEKVILIK